jgi:hypothetical protein
MGLRWCYRDGIVEAISKDPYRSCIINLADTGSKGTHWTVFRIVPYKNKNIIYYADPFGTNLSGFAPEELKIGYPIIENRITFQRPKTDLCGYYAILFAKAMDKINKHINQKDFEELLFKSIV